MITVIIVNWNTGSLLAQCLESLVRLGPAEHALIRQIIVVDNASHDGSIQRVMRRDTPTPPVSFILLKENQGFARANNLAWDSVPPDDHVLLLNPDTEVTAGSIATLHARLAEDAKVGIIGPRLHNPDGSLQLSVRRLPTLSVFIWLFLKLHYVWPNARVWQQYLATDFDYSTSAEVQQVMGAAFLIRNELWHSIGRLDPGFWIWFEEVDYCQRALNAGWKVLYEPRAQVIHHGAASFNQLIGWSKTWPFLASSLTYTRKHLGYAAWLALVGLLPIALALVIPASIVHVWRRRRPR